MIQRVDPDRAARFASLAVPTLYVLATGWAMTALSYDIWGAFIVAPVLVIGTVPFVRRIFRDQDPATMTIALIGFVVHVGGSVVRYWVAFRRLRRIG